MLVDPAVVERVLGSALSRGGDFAEVFVEDRRAIGASLDDGRVEELSSGRDRGAGVRVVVGETTGYAHTADLSESGLLLAAEAAAAVARQEGGTRTVALSPSEPTRPYDVTIFPEDVEKARKIELLARADDAARSAGSAITQVSAGYGDSRRRILVANSDGVLVSDDQVRSRFSVSCVAMGDTGMQTGFESAAFTVGFELFDTVDVEEIAAAAARRALSKLSARPAPSGEVPIVLASGSGGILFHEACGHGLEADHIAKDASVYVGQVGSQVASPLVTLVDDGTIAREWGTFAVDDEGRPAQRNVLIEDGILTDYMIASDTRFKAATSGAGTVDRSVTTSGPLAPERGWITCSARKLFPVPVSPSTSRGSGDRTSVSIWRLSSVMAGARPQKIGPS